ncbi:MAG: magnesium/cobalt transporter CorA [Candidatus Woesearchaeota archaeon]
MGMQSEITKTGPIKRIIRNIGTRMNSSGIRGIRKSGGKSSKKAGMPPGSIVHVGRKSSEPISINLIDYTGRKITEKTVRNISECREYLNRKSVTWININGLHDTKNIKDVGDYFKVHPLVLEDIANTEQRPKIEDYGDYMFIVLKMLSGSSKDKDVESEQVSLIVGKGFVVSFQEKRGDLFGPLRERIRKSKGKIRESGPDYLAYAIMDIIVDNYFHILEITGEEIEEVESEVVSDPKDTTLNKIYALKRKLISMKKIAWPLREVANDMQKPYNKLIKKSTSIYLHDVHDHVIQVIDTLETYRDLVSGMLDTYLSVVSNKMNEVMKVLTIFAAIFIPLTFIAGVYGMNFRVMPELEWKYGYLFVWIIMITLGVSMLAYFRRKGWM